jgi:hypothetical protein
VGFLKCYYTAGMVGGNAGYYEFPKGGFDAQFAPDAPPHWIRQMIALAHVHALFSHLEPFLREGELLPGPGRHRLSPDFPAYEFSTGDADARVLVRKRQGRSEWIVTAWAAAGSDREVRVSIPEAGELVLLARTCGSVYRVSVEKKQTRAKLLDKDGRLPSATIRER